MFVLFALKWLFIIVYGLLMEKCLIISVFWVLLCFLESDLKNRAYFFKMCEKCANFAPIYALVCGLFCAI